MTACSGDGDPAGMASGPSYYRDILPILNQHCAGCHREGGIGPFTLGSYEDAVAHAQTMVLATASRQMPPWGVDNSGDCNSYRDAQWLTDEQIELIGDWSESGMAMGDPADALAPPERAALEVGLTLDMEVEYMPNRRVDDDYRCFIMDPELDHDAYVTGYSVRPGQPTIVHHVILFSLESDAAEQAVQNLDDAEDGPGYTCYGGPGTFDGIGLLAGWAPGTPATFYPDGTGPLISAGRKVVAQVHYNLHAGFAPDRTLIDLQLSDSVTSRGLMFPAADFGLRLEPGLAYTESEAEFSTADLPVGSVKIRGVYPHMHTLGRTLRVEVERVDGSTVCVSDTPAWDFHWQRFYFFEDPIDIFRGDIVRIRCGYDTTSRTDVVRWGEGTQDEMCLNGMYATLF